MIDDNIDELHFKHSHVYLKVYPPKNGGEFFFAKG